MHVPSESYEASFGKHADLFTTFLYAAAIHIVIGEFFYNSWDKTFANSLPLVFIIVYLLSDWSSRVRLPRLSRETPRAWEQLAKAFLEAIGLLFLILAIVLFLSDAQGDRVAFAAAFLVVTFLWNLVQFKVMDKLDFVPLVRDIVRGTVLEMEAVQVYANGFVSYRGTVEADAQKGYAELTAAHKPQGKAARLNLELAFSAYMAIAAQGFLRTFAQYIGIHLGLANGLVGAAVAAHALWSWPRFLVSTYQAVMHFRCIFVMLPLVMLILPASGIAANLFRMKGRRVLCWAMVTLGVILAASVVVCWVFAEWAQPTLRRLSYLSLLAVGPALMFAFNADILAII